MAVPSDITNITDRLWIYMNAVTQSTVMTARRHATEAEQILFFEQLLFRHFVSFVLFIIVKILFQLKTEKCCTYYIIIINNSICFFNTIH